jgi:hypothetical protein
MYRALGDHYPVLVDSMTFTISVFCSLMTALIIGFDPMSVCFGPTVLGAVIWELPGVTFLLPLLSAILVPPGLIRPPYPPYEP